MNALPIIIGSLCVIAISYRYYSAFIAAKVLALDDSRPVPSQTMFDGHNYYPTNKWVLFGHHFAAISGAGPLIGPVLAAQFGFLPGLLWLVIGVCLSGAVHDFMILVGSIRRKGKSLAEIARTERSEEHTSELQSQSNLVCRPLLEKKKQRSSLDTARAGLP